LQPALQKHNADRTLPGRTSFFGKWYNTTGGRGTLAAWAVQLGLPLQPLAPPSDPDIWMC